MTFHFSVLWSQLDRFGFDFTVEKNPLNQKDVQWILMRFILCPNRIFKTSRLQDSYQWQFSGGRIRGIRSCGDWSCFETGVARHHCPDHLKGQALSPPDVWQEIPSEVRTRQCVSSLMWVCRHASGAGSSHQQVVGCSQDVDEKEHSDLWQIFHEEADKVFPSHDDQSQIALVPIVMFSFQGCLRPWLTSGVQAQRQRLCGQVGNCESCIFVGQLQSLSDIWPRFW